MTIRAAVLPGSWTAVVVAELIGNQWACRLVESFEVGQVGSATTGRLVRDVSPDDTMRAATRAMQRIRGARADSVVVDWSEGSKFHEIAQLVGNECDLTGVRVDRATKWRRWSIASQSLVVPKLLASRYSHWPVGTFSVSRNAGAMLVTSLEGEPTREVSHGLTDAVERVRVDAPSLPRGDLGASFLEESNVETEDNGGVLATSRKDDDLQVETDRDVRGGPVEPARTLGQPVIAGVDSGSAHLGLAIARGAASPLDLLLARTFPVGEKVALPRPRKVKRADGTIHEVTHRHSLTPEHVRALALYVVWEMKAAGVTVVALEHVDSVHAGSGNPAAFSSIATALLRSSWVENEIAIFSEQAGIEVRRVGLRTWRSAVAGHVKGASAADEIGDAVRAGFSNWPATSDQHERDAAGLCLWIARPPVAPRSVKVPREPVIRDRASKTARKNALAAARRAAAGCVCPLPKGAHHLSGCVLAVTSEKKIRERRALGCECNVGGRHRRECPLFKPKGVDHV